MSSAYTVKKVSDFSVPSQDVANQTFPAGESLVSDIQAGDGKIANLFYNVCMLFYSVCFQRHLAGFWCINVLGAKGTGGGKLCGPLLP
jgi:hypothetical protein